MKKLAAIAILLFAVTAAKSQTTISITEVSKHIGETVTICDSVYTGRTLANLTLLNLGGAFPKQTLTIVVNKSDIANFKESPEKLYLNKKICIMGKITEYNGKPQILATKPEQFSIK